MHGETPDSHVEAKRRLNIVFITITFDPEPGAQHGLPLARWLIRRGHSVKVITAFPQYPIGRIYDGYRMRWRQWETMDGVAVLRVPIYPSHDSSAFRRIATYISFMISACLIGVPSVGPSDVVFLYEPPPTNGVAALLMKWFRRTPFVQHVADIWPDTVINSGMIRGRIMRALASRIIASFCRFLYSQAHFVSVHSPSQVSLMRERGVPASKTRTIVNWVDEELYRPLEKDPVLAARYGMAGRFNFLFAGNFGPMQNVEMLVRAAGLLTDTPAIQLVLIGTGPLAWQVKATAKDLNATNVRFIERQSQRDMPSFNALGDVHLVHLRPVDSLRATIPSKIQVAMASARPILIGAEGDAAKLVDEAGAGVVCAPDNPESIAEAMLGLYRLPTAELEALGASGREYYLSNLTLESAGEVFEELLLSAVSASASASSNANHPTLDQGYD